MQGNICKMAKKIIIHEKIIKIVSGTAVPKPEDDQNTDDMVYGGKLNLITFKGYGKELFANERKDNPNHPLNDPRYKGAKILIGGENYACGSSREHAPQAHLEYGFNALITAGYAGIFQANSASIGLVATIVPKSDIEKLTEITMKNPETVFEINLENKLISYDNQEGLIGKMPFEIPENIRQDFLDGTWDAITLLRNNPEQVKKTMEKIPYFGFK